MKTRIINSRKNNRFLLEYFCYSVPYLAFAVKTAPVGHNIFFLLYRKYCSPFFMERSLDTLSILKETVRNYWKCKTFLRRTFTFFCYFDFFATVIQWYSDTLSFKNLQTTSVTSEIVPLEGISCRRKPLKLSYPSLQHEISSS